MNASRLLALLAALLLSACDDADDERIGFAGLADDASQYAQVLPGRPLIFPVDHGPHEGFRIEWWYITANLKDDQGTPYGVQWTLFRNALPRRQSVEGEQPTGWSDRNIWLGHAAVTSRQAHYASERYARGGIGQAGVTFAPFNAWIDDWSLTSQSAGGDPLATLQLRASDPRFAYQLRLTTDHAPVLQGDNGFSQKSAVGQASYYYSQPFFQVDGELRIDGQPRHVTGTAWLDREWSSQPLTAEQTGWDWFSLHLANGEQVMLYRMRNTRGTSYLTGTWIGADGHTEPLRGEDIELTPLSSAHVAGRDIPVRWSVKVPGKGLDITTEALNPKAWMNLRIPYWEGPITLEGSQRGTGYLEMTGY